MKNSGIEIELKFPLSEHPDEFLKRFANPGKRIYQKTVMFDNNQNLMQKTNGRIRMSTSFANFLEIEGEEESVKKVALDLGFNLDQSLIKACDTLFTEWRATKGLAMKLHMRFEDYDK